MGCAIQSQKIVSQGTVFPILRILDQENDSWNFAKKKNNVNFGMRTEKQIYTKYAEIMIHGRFPTQNSLKSFRPNNKFTCPNPTKL